MNDAAVDNVLASFLQAYGLKDTGYVKAGYDRIRSELEDLARELFGSDIVTDDTTGIGQFITLVAVETAKEEAEAEKTWFSGFPMTGSGVALDHLAPIAGVKRYATTHARYIVTAKGLAESIEPLGFRVSTDDDILFWAIEDVEFDKTGSASFVVESVEPGQVGNIDPKDITRIVNPTINATSVQGVSMLRYGNARESDFAFRQRIVWAMKGIGTASIPAITAHLLRVEGVVSVLVIENDTDFVDAFGRPPHSIEAYVLGGDDSAIAQTICDKKAAGIQTTGQKSVFVYDYNKQLREMFFSRIHEKPIYIEINIWKDGAYIAESPRNIKDALVQKIGGVTSNGERVSGYSIGEDVHITDLYAEVYKEAGVRNVKMKISIDGVTFSENDIFVEAFQVATTVPANITIIEHAYEDK